MTAAPKPPTDSASERDREMAESFCDAHGWVVLTEPFVGKVQLHFEDELAAAIAAARAEGRAAGYAAGQEAMLVNFANLHDETTCAVEEWETCSCALAKLIRSALPPKAGQP